MIQRWVQALASLKLTIFCLSAALALVFIGTIAQVEQGLFNAQNRYFRSFLVFWGPAGAGWKIPVFPGGYLIGGLLMVNLLFAQALRLRFTWGNFGLALTHAGLILLLAGQMFTDLFQVESHMRITEGQTVNYSESGRLVEMIIVDASKTDVNEEITIPDSLLARGGEIRHPAMPMVVQTRHFAPNSNLAQLRAGETNGAAATQGFGREIRLSPAPLTTKMDERNLPSVVVELFSAQSRQSLGTWLISLYLGEPQTVVCDGKAYHIGLRNKRYYKPFTLQLLKFTHEVYPGTQIPKNFSSRVRLQNPATQEDREVLIYMNTPLRYGGETYYQASFDEKDPQAVATVLQVVRNPSWLAPYLACILVSVGLCWQFLIHLAAFIKQRKTA